MENTVIIKILKGLYIFIFIFAISLITTMHIVPEPALAIFRIPQNLREVGPMLGLAWPTSLQVYHVLLLFFFAVIILNGIGLYRLHIARWRSACRISSFLGLLLAWSIFLFFMLPLILNSNFDAETLRTSFIYSIFAFIFFNVDLLTFVVVQKERKETLRP